MATEHHLVGSPRIADDVLEHPSELVGNSVAHSVGQVDRGCAGLDGGLDDFL
mgnify:CR=1 FL=1